MISQFKSPTIPTPKSEEMAAPFNNHIATMPVVVPEDMPEVECRHRISALLSPLKSPTSLICQFRSPTIPTPKSDEITAPFINHMATLPVVECRHRISAFPSPLKSPVSCICQPKSLTIPTPKSEEIL